MIWTKNILIQKEIQDFHFQVEFALTFTYEPMELFYVSSLLFTLSVKNDVDSDTDQSNNKATVNVEVKKQAALYPSGWVSNIPLVTIVLSYYLFIYS